MSDYLYILIAEGDVLSVIKENEISDYEDVVAYGYAQVLCIDWLSKRITFLTMEDGTRVWEPVN